MPMIKLNIRQNDQFLLEIREAKESGLAGYTGRMRVCVRRAVSILTDAWMETKGIESPYSDVYRTFNYLLPIFDQQTEVKEILIRLTTRVDETYKTPQDDSFIKDAYRLAYLLDIEVEEVE